MCGIAGIFHYGDPGRPVDRPLLQRMLRAIAHRGPDGEGIHVDGPIGLGHRRLSIVDLSDTGRQPMASDDGALWISYNGEFYNHAEHRARLAAARPFRGTSDTETLLRLFEERGAACFAGVTGIFGVALWDGRRRALTLARDPLGVKQLYYHDDGRRIVFASEIKALLECDDVPRELDEEGINQFLHFHTPLFDRTSFRGVRQLCPGEHLTVSARGKTRRTYFEILDFEHHGSAADQIAELRDLVGRVVRDQLMADVPVGAFLSGGIDSSAVASFIRRAGAAPTLRCFGVHFSNQGVVDERPYQEAVAKALGVDLELITLDGSTFPEDLLRALYFQDEPVIGAAMLPMYHVSRLAAGRVKVCMGGQGADEVFGGYARYALASPLRVARSWLFDRGGAPRRGDAEPAPPPGAAGLRAPVGGNLLRQLADPKTLRRLARGVTHAGDWRELYFENFAKVPERAWARVIAAPEIVSRRACRETFYDALARSPARDPFDRAMHWDVQTYLPGLFHQDDRMSMAHGLESRVPLADPRLVRFAFRLDPTLKIRGGATKWALRQAVADVLPAWVLNRRKVGFDTPAERWMRQRHAGFVRDLLLSSRARHRGLWDPRGVEALLDHPGERGWFDVAWKVLVIEAWAQTFLDAPPARGAREGDRAPIADIAATPPAPSPPPPPAAAAASDGPPAAAAAGDGPLAAARDALQELRELGPRGAAFRTRWEISTRTGLVRLAERAPPPAEGVALSTRDLPFGDGRDVAAALEGRVPEPDIERLRRIAGDAARGRILCFSRWIGDYGDPIDWHRNPVNGRRWSAARHWSRALSEAPRVGDVKLTWEVGRFPQAFHMARAAALCPDAPAERGRMAEALALQIERFIEGNPRGLGVHWVSGQEIAFRMMAWLFAFSVLGDEPPLARAAPAVAVALREAAAHIEQHLDYARIAVYNNHLLSEAFGLLLAARVLPAAPESARWRRLGTGLLEEQAAAQVYEDGAYIQNSHTYHRVAMHNYLWASALERRAAGAVPPAWTAAMERSLDFLYAQQNPGDGRLPNFGANDGALPSVLSTCDYTDFRPLLQALSVATRGERLFEPGPWDEATAWLAGAGAPGVRAALDAPLRPRPRRSASFGPSGYHVLRGADPGSFAALRCGPLRDRFSQIDMLHLDVFWRGHNVAIDAGSYLYNGPQRWHELFIGTSSHNTVALDGRDQMLHYRRFKNIYGIRAELLAFEDRPAYALVEGEHHGYARHPGGCVHRRAVLFVKDDLWIVADRLLGDGTHAARLHWLGGDFPRWYDPAAGALTLATPAGPFSITVLDEAGAPLAGDVTAGGQDPPRGWTSRYYGEKVPVPSLAVERVAPLPLTLISVLAPGRPEVRVDAGRVAVVCGAARVRFQLDDGRISAVEVDPTPAAQAAAAAS